MQYEDVGPRQLLGSPEGVAIYMRLLDEGATHLASAAYYAGVTDEMIAAVLNGEPGAHEAVARVQGILAAGLDRLAAANPDLARDLSRFLNGRQRARRKRCSPRARRAVPPARRARSSCGGRRRPGARRTRTSAATRGDPDEPPRPGSGPDHRLDVGHRRLDRGVAS
jgi:hypothetical protein